MTLCTCICLPACLSARAEDGIVPCSPNLSIYLYQHTHAHVQAKQLPTSEAGAAAGEEGIEFSISSQFSITDEDDVDQLDDPRAVRAALH